MTQTQTAYLIEDRSGAFLKPNHSEFVRNEKLADRIHNLGRAKALASVITKAYIEDGITDVWGQPKRVKVVKMTVTTEFEDMTGLDDDKQTEITF